MMCKIEYRCFCCALIIIFAFLISYPSFAAAQQAPQESDQQISDFSLAGYGDKGKKSWELSGKSADIFSDVVKLKDITGNLYGKEEDIKLTSDNGDFNKAEGKIHLENNVVITTTSGAKLTTDSLDWDRKNSVVSTQDLVNIVRDNMVASGQGARGETNLKKVNLQKDVKVKLVPEGKGKDEAEAARENIVITCDGPMEIDYERNIAVFTNNVKVDRQDSVIYCDTMDVYFLKSAEKKEAAQEKEGEKSAAAGFMSDTSIDRIICRGNVRIVRGENVSYSEEAIYTAKDKKITLTGRPKLVLYSTEEFANAPSGD